MLLTFLKRIFIDKSLGMGTFSTSMEPYINLLKVIIFIEEGILIVKSLMLISYKDLQIKVHLGILVTRKKLSWQEILSESAQLHSYCKTFL